VITDGMNQGHGPSAAPAGSVIESKPCVGCGYDLLGLPVSGKCPECGLDVERSLKGDLLEFAGPDYLAKLHTGVVWIQGALIAMVAVAILSVAIGIIVGFGAFAPLPRGVGGTLAMSKSWIDALSNGLQLLIALASAWGWWQFSEPDPGQVSTNKGEGPRKWVRIATIAKLVTTLGVFVVQLIVATGVFSSLMVRTPGAGMSPGAVLLLVLIGGFSLLNLAAMATWFFASMLYIKWLAGRVPSQRSIDRAKLMMWLGPVLSTVGALACGTGPIAAMVLYYIQLEWMRLDIKRIRQRAASGAALV
jgi:hypothetical protein